MTLAVNFEIPAAGETSNRLLKKNLDLLVAAITASSPVSGIGDPISTGTSGSVLYVDSSVHLAQNNSKLFWDATNNRLGIGTNSPSAILQVNVATATSIGAIFKTTDGSATKSLTEWWNSSGTRMTHVDSAGDITFDHTNGHIFWASNAMSIYHDGSSGAFQNNTGSFSFINTSASGSLAFATNGSNRFVVDVNGLFTMWDGGNFSLGTTTGTKIGTATTQKIGFFNATPIVRPAAYTPTNVTTDRSYDANASTLDEALDVLGTLIADLQSLGLIG